VASTENLTDSALVDTAATMLQAPTEDSLPAEVFYTADTEKQLDSLLADHPEDSMVQQPFFVKLYDTMTSWVTKVPAKQFVNGLVRVIAILLCGGIVVYLLLQAWIRIGAAREKNRFLTNTRLSVMDREVRLACQFIQDHFSDSSLDSNMICEQLVTGQGFLQALFEKELGMSVEDFISQVRVHALQKALEQDPGMQLRGVESDYGFNSFEELEQTFVKITGVTCADFARSYAGKNM